MEGLQKIDLAPLKENPIPQREINEEKGSSKKKLIIPLFIIGFLIIFVFAVILPIRKVYSSSFNTYNNARIAWEAVKKQNIELASSELEKTRKELKQTQKDIKGVSYLRFIPIVSWYYNDADHIIKAGFYGLDAAEVVIDSIEP
ncbi:MAG: hypothetical protein Q7K11_01590, partial [Candidatus Berkelbacteria bacterium]|nr:hypothetical protein [Candidatus Berkelbacteria bacterium]